IFGYANNTSCANYFERVFYSENDAFDDSSDKYIFEGTYDDYGSYANPIFNTNMYTPNSDYNLQPNIYYTITAYGPKGSVSVSDSERTQTLLKYGTTLCQYMYFYKYMDLDDDGEKDFVSKYVIDAKVTYGARKLGSYKITYQGAVKSLGVTRDVDNSKTAVAVGEDAIMAVKVDTTALKDEQKPSGFTYTWYAIDSEGNETEITHAHSSSLTTPVTDYDTTYKCVVAVNFASAGLGELKYEVPFTVTAKSDYELTDVGIRLSGDSDLISTARMETDVVEGDTATMFANCLLGDEYNINYYWTYKASYKNDNTLEVLSETNELSLQASLADPSKFSDNYYLTAHVTDEWGDVDEYYVYKFHLNVIDFKVTGDRDNPVNVKLSGESVTLVDDTEIDDSVKTDRYWYKKISEEEVKALPEGMEYIKIPKSYSYKLIETGETGIYSEYVVDSYEYYLLVGEEDEYEATETGLYICRNDYDNDGVTGSYDKYFRVVGDSGLLVMAKNTTVRAEKGTSVTLEVVAKNNDSETYPISYKWAKLNQGTGEFDALGSEEATYTIEEIKNSDFGVYRVIVNDTQNEAEVLIYLRTNEEEPTYDSRTKLYYRAIGEEVTMTPDITFKNPVHLEYQWFEGINTPDVKDSMADGSYDTVDGYNLSWVELDEKSDSYYEVVSEYSYGFYKCVVTYQTTEVDASTKLPVEKTVEMLFRIKPYEEATIEPTTATEQIKVIGDSAAYGVRMVNNEEGMDLDSVTYQWYRIDLNDLSNVTNTTAHMVPIEGETESTYVVDKITADDYGYIMVVASYTEADGFTRTWTQSFNTLGFTSEVYREDKENRYCQLGNDIALMPKVDNFAEDGTYQWYIKYPDSDEVENGYQQGSEYFVPDSSYVDPETGNLMAVGEKYVPIPGANSLEYNITNAGENDYTDYLLVVYKDGAPCLTYFTTLLEGSEDDIKVSLPDGMDTTMYAPLGTHVRLAVDAYSTKGQDLTYRWYFGTGDTSDISKYYLLENANDNSLVIKNIVDTQFGNYVLTITDEDGNIATVTIALVKTSSLEVDYDALNEGEVKGIATTFGGEAVLDLEAYAFAEYDKSISYSWYKATEYGRWTRCDINALEGSAKKYNQEVYGDSNTLTLSDVSEDDLGYYRCEIKTPVDTLYAYYYVYVNTHLFTSPGVKNPIADSTGKLTMNVYAEADEAVYYEWSKKVEEEKNVATVNYISGSAPESDEDDEYEIIEGKTENSLVFNPLTKDDYGEYRVKVWTRGEVRYFTFEVAPRFSATTDQLYVRPGDEVTLKLSAKNLASDVTYGYTWYGLDTMTDTMAKIEGEGTSITATIPDVTFNKYDDDKGYVDYSYTVKISDESEYDYEVLRLEDKKVICGGIRVIPNAPAGDKIPEISHPFGERCNLQTYTLEGAEYLKIKFEKASLLSEEKLHIIAEDGSYIEVKGTSATYHFMNNGVEQTSEVTDFETGKSFGFDGISEHTLALKGKTVTFLLFGNDVADSYGYGITSIDALTQEEIDNNDKGDITGDATPVPVIDPDETTVPGSESAAPGSESAAPGSETSVPGSESAAPGSESAAPGSESAAPGSETSAPGSETSAPGSTNTPGNNGNNGNGGSSAASGSVIINQYLIMASNAATGSEVTLTVDQSKVVVKQGSSLKVNFKSVNASGTAVRPTVSSSKENIATAKVNSDTELEITVPAGATKGASANITLTAGGKTATIKVTVENPTKKLKAKKKKVTVKANKTAKVVLNIKAENKKKKTTDTLKASYKPKKIAKVTSKSITKNKVTVKVKGLKKGKTKMTITIGAKKVTIDVKVK
nr:hypothetical protein [Lachnospiraceae bacterium]